MYFEFHGMLLDTNSFTIRSSFNNLEQQPIDFTMSKLKSENPTESASIPSSSSEQSASQPTSSSHFLMNSSIQSTSSSAMPGFYTFQTHSFQPVQSHQPPHEQLQQLYNDFFRQQHQQQLEREAKGINSVFSVEALTSEAHGEFFFSWFAFTHINNCRQ